jgi:hypothetical protein
MADDPLDNLKSAEDNIASLLAQIMSPEMAAFASMIIKGSMGDVINNNMGKTGGTYGPSPLFGGPRDVGVDMMDTFYRRSIEDTMRGSEQALRQSMFDAKVSAHTAMGSADPQKAATEFNLTNFATHLMMSTREPRQLQAGAIQAARFMGVGPTVGLGEGSRELQADINANAGNLMARLTADFMNPANMNDYYGFGGGDVGRAYAELSRTGAFNDFNGTDASFAQQRTRVTEFLGSVRAASRFYDGGFMDVVDQMNATVGVNARATFGGADTEMMYMRMHAAGRAANLSNSQMLSLAMQSAQVSRGMGYMDSTTALVAATESGVVLRGAMRNGGRFVNEQRMRAGLVTMATSAANSEMAEMLSGAYVSLAEDQRELFMNDVLESGANDENSILALARKRGFTGTGVNLRNIGKTQDAREVRAENQDITAAALSAQTRMESDHRRMILRRTGMGAVADAIEGTVTLEKLGTALLDFYDGDKVKAGDKLGLYTESFDREARRFNMTGEELEGIMVGAERNARQKLVRDTINQRVKVDNAFKHMGKVSGIQGILGFVDAVAKGEKGTAKGLFQSFMGLSDADYADFLGAANPEQFAEGAKQFFTTISEGDDVELIAGLDVLGNVMQTHKLDGKRVSKEDMRKYYELAAGNLGDAEADKLLRDLAGSSDVKMRKKVAEWSATKKVLAGRDVEDIKPFQDEAQEYAMNEQLMELIGTSGFREKAMTRGGVSAGDLMSAKKIALKVNKFLAAKGSEGMDILEDKGYAGVLDNVTKEEIASYEKVLGVGKRQDDLMKAFDDTDPMTTIANTLSDIFNFIKEKAGD